MNLLALDTSTEACSAAVLRADGRSFACFDIAPRQHNQLLPEMMDTVLRDANLDRAELTHCAFANGPGAFTGIRIAAAQAQGVGMGLGIPLVTISTLAVLAQTGIANADVNNVLVALDARMNEIYWAVYQRDETGLARLRGNEHLDAQHEVCIDSDIEYGVGHGWHDALRASVDFPVDSSRLPSAAAMLPLAQDAVLAGRTVHAENAAINYLRMQVAQPSRA